VNVAGAIFEIDSEGKAMVRDLSAATPELLEEAVDSCPVSAISVDDEPTEMKSPHA
jgi:ferredoxin